MCLWVEVVRDGFLEEVAFWTEGMSRSGELGEGGRAWKLLWPESRAFWKMPTVMFKGRERGLEDDQEEGQGRLGLCRPGLPAAASCRVAGDFWAQVVASPCLCSSLLVIFLTLSAEVTLEVGCSPPSFHGA